MTDNLRKRFSSLYGLAVTVRPLTDAEALELGSGAIDHVALVRKDSGKVIATIARTDFFDPNGNRFYADA